MPRVAVLLWQRWVVTNVTVVTALMTSASNAGPIALPGASLSSPLPSKEQERARKQLRIVILMWRPSGKFRLADPRLRRPERRNDRFIIISTELVS